MIITNLKWKDKKGEDRVGYYMDRYKVQNLCGIPHYLKKAKDVVGIISGHGKVRIGKSTEAQQIGYFLAWLIAGGMYSFDKEGNVEREVMPKEEVHFSLNENVVFTPDKLMKVAENLYKKYGANQVIIYDEARAGLASDRAMESINKTMSEWFEQCGQYGHIILLVLPNFFKLHEDYAVARSLFLVDVFEDKKYNKGYFNFYNEMQKEKLYYFGKKRIGVTAKYAATNESFWGRFTSFMPLNQKEYEARKREAINKLKRTRYERKFIKRFHAACYLLKKYTQLSLEALSKELTPICGEPITEKMIRYGILTISQGEADEN